MALQDYAISALYNFWLGARQNKSPSYQVSWL